MESGSKLIKHPDPSGLSREDQAVLEAATQNLRLAYAPYSGFRVGAALITESGAIVNAGEPGKCLISAVRVRRTGGIVQLFNSSSGRKDQDYRDRS